MRKCILAAIATVLIFALAFAGCGKTQQPEVTVPPTESAPVEAVPESTAAPEVTIETEPTIPENCVIVDTPYGDLQFQDQWAEFMRVDWNQDGNTVTAVFYTEINSVRYDLFSLIIGEGDGGQAGQITGPDGVVRNVYVRMMELGETDTLSDGEQNRLFAMQEEINYVIDNLE